MKAFLGFVDLTNTAPLLKIEAGFRVILLCGPRLQLGRPYYESVLLFMMYTNSFYELLLCNHFPAMLLLWQIV